MLTASSMKNGDTAMTATKLMMAFFVVLMLSPVMAWAQPKIQIESTVETEITVEEGGRKVVKRVPAKTIEPGAVLIYTVRVSNKGDEKATALIVNNPVPNGTFYIGKSAEGKGSRISFSVDGGKTFDNPGRLIHEQKLANGKTKKRKAAPEHYTHIRWLIDEVPAGKASKLGFRVKVK